MGYGALIVDDEVFVRAWLKKCINWEKCGFSEIYEASNGAEALGILDGKKVDLVLTDLRMPIMDGIGFIAKVRETDARTRFIIITCLDDFSLVKQAIGLDVTSYILKLTSEVDEIEKDIEKAYLQLKRIDRYEKSILNEQEIVNADETEIDLQSSNARLNAAVSYLHHHFSDDINLQIVAMQVGVTPNYLGKLFLQEYGYTFTEELNHLRVDEAKKLLKDPSCRINDVSSKVGFVSPSYFFRIFKKYEFCTPTEYRLKSTSGA